MKTQNSRERQHKPDKQRNTHKQNQIKQNTKQDRKNWTKTQASTTNPKHKSKSFDLVRRNVEKRFERASNSCHSSLILLAIDIAFRLAETRRV
jgi:hypothetical protein